MPDLPLILNTGVEYVVNWLARMPSPIYESLPSFPSEGGTLFVYEGKRRNNQPSEVLVEMDGLFNYQDWDIPSRTHHQLTGCVVEFRLRPLSQTRAELTAAKSWLPAAEPYLASLLREMDRRWGESSRARDTSLTQTAAESTRADLPRSPLFHELDEFLDDLLRYQRLVEQEEEAEENERDLPPYLPTDPWRRPPEMDQLERKLIRRSVTLQDHVWGVVARSSDEAPAPYLGDIDSWHYAFEKHAIGRQATIDELIEQVKVALAAEVKSVRPSPPLSKMLGSKGQESVGAGDQPLRGRVANEPSLPPLRPADRDRYRSAWRLMTALRKLRWSNTKIAEHLKNTNPQLRVKDRETVAKVVRYGEAGLLDP